MSGLSVTLTILALLIEALVGYPDRLVGAIGHPVTWMGRLIAWCDGAWNSPELSFGQKRQRGVLALLVLVLAAAGAGLLVVALLAHLFAAWLALVAGSVLGSSLLAQRGLDRHVAAVASALERDGIEDIFRERAAQIVPVATHGDGGGTHGATKVKGEDLGVWIAAKLQRH